MDSSRINNEFSEGLQNLYLDPERISSTSDTDLFPAIDTQKDRIFFVADRRGNKDIWMKPLSGGAAMQITSHVADDIKPAISPDGSKMAFVSRRDDALGDIYIMDLSALKFERLFFRTQEGSLTRVSRLSSEDSSPSWLADSNSIVFTSKRFGQDESEILKYDLNSKEVSDFGKLYGTQVSASPDGRYLVFARNGALFLYEIHTAKITQLTKDSAVLNGQPMFGFNSDEIVFIRYVDDTNRDGKLNGEDRPTIWRISLGEKPVDNWRKPDVMEALSSSKYGAFTPVVRPEGIYASFETPDGINVYRIPRAGQISIKGEPEDIYRILFELDSDDDELFLLRAAQSYFNIVTKNRSYASDFALAELRYFVQSGRSIEATMKIQEIANLYEDLPTVCVLAEIEGMVLTFAHDLYPVLDRNMSANERKHAEVIKERLKEIIEKTPNREGLSNGDRNRIIMAATTLYGRILATEKNISEASRLIERFSALVGNDRSLLSEFSFLKALLAGDLAGEDRAIGLLMDTARTFADQKAILKQITKNIMRIAKNSGQSSETLRHVIELGDKTPYVGALLHRYLAEQFRMKGEEQVYVNELRQIARTYTQDPLARIEAARILSEIDEKRGSVESARKVWTDLSASMGFADRRSGITLRKNLEQFHLRVAHLMLNSRRFVDARTECDEVLSLNAGNISANRCRIESLVKENGVDQVIEEYEKKFKQEEDSAINLYLYAYALSYKVDQAPDISARIDSLSKVIELLEKARELNGNIAEFHQTIGWAYQQLGHWSKLREERAGLQEKLRKRITLVRDFFIGDNQGLVEKSIDAFDTAYYLSPKGSSQRAVLAQNLGHSFYEINSFQKSLDFFLERIAILQTAPMADKRIEGALLRRAGRAAFQVENLELASRLQRAALIVWEKVGQEKEVAYSLDALALTYRELGKWDEALQLYSRLLRIEERGRYDMNQVGTLTNMGYCLFSLSKYDDALASFARAEDLISQLESQRDEGVGNKPNDKDVISVDIGGEGSSAKGFDIFTRRNILLTMRGLIFEKTGRLDLAAITVKEKIAFLESEEQRRQQENSGKSTLSEPIIISHSRLGYLFARIGEERNAAHAYESAAELARESKIRNETGSELAEIRAESDRAKLKLRMVNLGIIGSNDIAQELDRIKKVLSSNAEADQRYLADRPDVRFNLIAVGSSFDSSTNSKNRQFFADNLKSLIDVKNDRALQGSFPKAAVSALRQIYPSIIGMDMPDDKDNEKDQVEDRNIGATPNVKEPHWYNFATSGAYDKAWHELSRWFQKGGKTSNPSERLAVRKIWETLARDQKYFNKTREMLEFWREFLAIRSVDLLRRGNILDAEMEQEAAELPGGRERRYPKYLVSSMEAIRDSLDHDAGILMVHQFFDRDVLFGLITKKDELVWRGGIGPVDQTGIVNALVQSGMMNAVRKLRQIYIVPDSEMFELNWEEFLRGSALGKDNFSLGYVPSPDLVPYLISRRMTPRDRVAFIVDGPSRKNSESRSRNTDLSNEREVAQQAIISRDLTVESDDVVHFAIPIYVNDVEPHLSGVGVKNSVEDGRTSRGSPQTLHTSCANEWREKAYIVLENTIRDTTDYNLNFDAHDGWSYTLLCAVHHGTPAVLWNEKVLPGFNRTIDEGNVLTKFWRNFYDQNSLLSLNDRILLGGFTGRILGDPGTSSSEEKRTASAAYGEILDEAEDSYEEGRLAVSAKLFKRALFLGSVAGYQDQRPLLTKIIQNYFRLRDFKSAYFYQNRKIEIIRTLDPDSSRQEIGEALVDAAVLAVRAEHFMQAQSLLNEAEAFYKDSSDLRVLGKIDHYRAINAENQGLYEDSIKWYESSRSRYQSVDEDEAAQRLLNIGNIYNVRLSDLPKALEYYQRARSYFRDEGQIESEIKVLVDISNALIAIGDLAQSIKIIEDEILPRVNREKSLDLWIRSKQMLGNAYLRRGQFENAQRLCREVIEAASKMSDPRDFEKREQRLVDALGLRSYLLSAQGDYQKSFEEFEATIQRAMDGKLQQQLAILYNNYGFWLREVGSLEKSVEMLERAVAIDTKLKSRSGLAIDRRNLGLSLIALGDLTRAKDLLENSLEESKGLFLSYNIAFCEFGLGDIAFQMGQWEDAKNRFMTALSLAQKGMMPDMEWRAFGAVGRVSQIQGRNKEAVEFYRKAIDRIEEREGGLRSESSRNRFLSDAGTQEIYAHFAKALMDEGQISEAWEIADRSRSRAYVDAIGSSTISLAREKSRILRERERSARLEMDQLWLAFRLTPKNEGLKKSAERATDRYFSILEEIESSDFHLVDLLRVKRLSLTEFINVLPKNVGVLSYLVTPSHLLIWTLRGGKIAGTQVAINSVDLEKKVTEYRALFENLSATEFVGVELSAVLLEPIKQWIKETENVVVIPHRSLHFVPYSSLPIEDKQFLDWTSISYVESARVAAHLLSDAGRFRPKTAEKVLAIVAPTRKDPLFLATPFAAKEVDALGRFYKDLTRLEGEQASEELLVKGTNAFSILHISAHGEYRPDQPAQSRLLLAETSKSDGNLTVKDILGMAPQASHVTLASCESGRGYLGSGDDVVSLDRAFFYAGARTVVSSLWRISDVTSAVTMKRYYRYLSQGHGPAKAMRLAQQIVRKYFKHPAYWASFRVIGDGL
jgi:CHAT domain-containing protein/tetratricopeptide (TPR) repeat protein/Tol biopolymer transport system component